MGNVRNSDFSVIGQMTWKAGTCPVKEPSHLFLARQEKSKRNRDSLSPNKTFLPYSANVKGFRMDLRSLLSPFALLESLNLAFVVRIESLVCSSGSTVALS